jgi:hypothetical protein
MAKGRVLWTALKVLAFLLVMVVLYFVLRGIGFRAILEGIKGVNPRSLWSAVLLNFAVFLLWSFRLQMLMTREERGSIVAMFPIYMAGVFGNVVTPGARVGGEPICAYYMWKVFGGEMSRHFGLVVADKLGSTVVFLAFVLISVCFVVLYVPVSVASKIALEAAVVLVVLGVVSGFLLRRHIGGGSGLRGRVLRAMYDFAVLRFIRRRFATYQHFEDYVIRKLDNVLGAVGRVATSPKSLARALLLSAAAWIVFCTANYVLFSGLGADVSFFEVLIITTISGFCGDVSFTPGGVGFMETAMIGLCAAFGVDNSVAATVTLISRGIFYVYGLGMGGLCLGVLACLYGRSKGKASPPSTDHR